MNWYILIFFCAHWWVSLFFQSGLLHRYAAHGMYTIRKGWYIVFRIASFIAMGSSDLSPRAYAIMHRLHHKYADTDEDTHNAGKGLIQMTKDMLDSFSQAMFREGSYKEKDKAVFRNLPPKTRLDNWSNKLYVRSAWVCIYLVIYILLADAWWQFLLLPITAIMGPFHGVIVNYLFHKVGYTSHKGLSNTSKNFGKYLPWLSGIIMCGENYHNNHHGRLRINFAEKWYECDPVYPILAVLEKLRIITIKPEFK